MSAVEQAPLLRRVVTNSLVVGAFLAAWAHHDWDPWMPVAAAAKAVLLYVCISCFSIGISLYVGLGVIGLLPGQPNHKYLFPRSER